MARKATRPTIKDWDRVRFTDSDWVSFDLSGAYRAITEVLPSEGYCKSWKRHMESKGYETKYKYYDSETTKGVALLARPILSDR